MFVIPPTVLAGAAETRRRELPASVALIVLTGGLGAAMLGEGGPIGWAVLMSGLLITDAEIYRRLDVAETRPARLHVVALSVWAFVLAAIFAALPAALWLSGGAAASAAAMALWIAGAIRQLGANAGAPLVALAGVAPPALTLLLSPLAMAALTDRPDWDLAVIAAIGGGALLAYVAHARLAAEDAAQALRARAASDEAKDSLTNMLLEQGPFAACLVDRNFSVVAMSAAARRGFALEEDVSGRGFAELVPWRPPHWREAQAKAFAGESSERNEDVAATPAGLRWYDWRVRPWRDENGVVCGALMCWHDVTALTEARRAAEAETARLRASAGQRVPVLVVDPAEQTRELACEALEKLGFTVLGAPGAAEALDMLKLVKPALILLDVDMSYDSGWRLLDTLKDIAGTRDIPVIAVSGGEDRADALAAGACEHLVKPIGAEMLASAVARFARAPEQADEPSVLSTFTANFG